MMYKERADINNKFHCTHCDTTSSLYDHAFIPIRGRPLLESWLPTRDGAFFEVGFGRGWNVAYNNK